MSAEDRRTIREAEEADAEELLALYAPYVTDTAITFEYEVPSKEEFTERIRNIQKRYPYLVAVSQGKIAGYAYASAFKSRAAYDWAVEVTIYVRRDARGSGIGTELYRYLERALRKQGILNLNACIACPKGEDPYLTEDSMRFHRNAGYRLVGRFHDCGFKFHRWYDMIWMEKCIGPHVPNQPAVKSFPEIKEEWRSETER
ncbi:MAG: GNAT family N-acetyltransferase [Butyricicoccus sp.]